jgi:hypothetical protein
LQFEAEADAVTIMLVSKKSAGQKPIRDRGEGEIFGIKGPQEGLPLIGIFNENIRHFSHKDRLPWLLSISSSFSETFANGFPRDPEFASLREWEDLLIATVGDACQFAWVGHVTWNGFREVFFHVDQPERVATALNGLAMQKKPRSFQFEIDLDEEWARVSVYFKKEMKSPD